MQTKHKLLPAVASVDIDADAAGESPSVEAALLSILSQEVKRDSMPPYKPASGIKPSLLFYHKFFKIRRYMREMVTPRRETLNLRKSTAQARSNPVCNFAPTRRIHTCRIVTIDLDENNATGCVSALTFR